MQSDSTRWRRRIRPANLKHEQAGLVYVQIVDHIRRVIQRGELAPGDRLLPERQLAEQLGASRNSVREGLALLAGMGLVDIKPRGGAYVKERSLDSVIALLAAVLVKERQDVYHLLEARRIIEAGAARLAARRATEEDMVAIRGAAAEVAREIRARRDADRSDTRFHRLMVDAAHNPVLQSLMSVLSALMEEEYGPSRRALLKDRRRAPAFLAQHEAVVNAVAVGDSERAEQTVREHIDFAVESLLRLDRDR